MKYQALLVLAGTVVSSGMAYSADVDLNKVPEVVIVDNNTHWYGKAYTGLVIADLSGLSHLKNQPGQDDFHWKNRGDMNEAFLIGLGLGYRFNDLFRVDGSFEYRAKNSVHGSDIYGLEKRSYDADVSSMVLMANAYVDLGTFKNITPYLGAGLGAANNRISHFSVESDTQDFQSATKTNWDLAWAVHAGIGVKLNSKVTLDIGYSYSDLGDAKSENTQQSGHVKFDSLTSHDIKIGLRYAFQ